MARLSVQVGDLLDEEADVLLCTANPHLRMSGGVNGAILARGGEAVQAELDGHLRAAGRAWVPRGSVVRTGPGPLKARHLLHVVGVDAFYQTDVGAVAAALRTAFAEAARLGARTVALPAIATGYGPLTLGEFLEALSRALPEAPAPIEELRLVVRRAVDGEEAARMLPQARLED